MITPILPPPRAPLFIIPKAPRPDMKPLGYWPERTADIGRRTLQLRIGQMSDWDARIQAAKENS